MDPKRCLWSIQKAVSGFQIRSFRPIRDGWDFFVLEVNGEWMFRFPRRPAGITQLKREAAFLEKASPQLPVSVPRYERICWDSEPPFGGYRKVAGLSLSDARNTPPDVSADLGCFLSALHSLSPEGVFPSESVEQADWVALWQRRVRLWEERVLKALDPFLESAVRDWSRRLLEILDSSSVRLTPIHGDLSADHVLIRNGRLSGVIDWGDACLGDPALDFAALWHELGETFTRETARHGAEYRDGTFWIRADLYRKLAPLHGLLHALEQGDGRLWEVNMRRLKETAV
ncbi:MAG: phosphotransferase [Planifilum fimeticola]|jgi:aminoglycoside 2''-phosphotransferase